MKKILLMLVLVMVMGGSALCWANDPRVFHAVYDFPKITNIRVNLTTSGLPAMLLFDVGDEHYIWQFKDAEGGQVSALFVVADRLEKASRIEIERWLPQPGTRDRSGYTIGNTTYFVLSDLIIYK